MQIHNYVLESQRSASNFIFVDYLRVLAVFLVILIHNGDTFLSFNHVFSLKWGYANFLHSFARISVPLFFMISGFLLLKPNINLNQFYSKRLKRVIIPLLFWSIIYILFRIFVENNQISLLSAIRLIWTGSVYYHLWFLYAIVGIYFTIPFISRFIIDNSIKQPYLVVFTVVWFLFFSLLPFIGHFLELLFSFNFEPDFHLNMFIGYLGFFPLGYLLGNLMINRKRIFLAILILISSCFITVIGNYYYNINNDNFDEFFNYYKNPNIILSAASVFYLFKALPLNKDLEFIRYTCNLSFGIYLVHPLLLYFLKNNSFTSDFFESNLLILRSFCIFLATWLVVFLISKTPILKNVI